MITYDGVSYLYEWPTIEEFPILYKIEQARKGSSYSSLAKPLQLNEWLSFVLDLLMVIKCIEIEHKNRGGLVFVKTEALKQQCDKACWFFHEEVKQASSIALFTTTAISLLPKGQNNESCYSVGIHNRPPFPTYEEKTQKESDYIIHATIHLTFLYSKIGSRATFLNAISLNGFDKTPHVDQLKDELNDLISKISIVIKTTREFHERSINVFAKYIKTIRDELPTVFNDLNVKIPMFNFPFDKSLSKKMTWELYSLDRFHSTNSIEPSNLWAFNILRILEWIRFTQLFCDKLCYESSDGWIYKSPFSKFAKQKHVQWIEKELSNCYHAYIVVESFFNLHVIKSEDLYVKQVKARLSNLKNHLTIEKIEEAKKVPSRVIEPTTLNQQQLSYPTQNPSFEQSFDFFRMHFSYLRTSLFIYQNLSHSSTRQSDGWTKYLVDIKQQITKETELFNEKIDHSNLKNSTIDESILDRLFFDFLTHMMKKLPHVHIPQQTISKIIYE